MAPKRKVPTEASDGTEPQSEVDKVVPEDPQKKARGRPKKGAVSKDVAEAGGEGESPTTTPKKKAEKKVAKQSAGKSTAGKVAKGESGGVESDVEGTQEKKPKKAKPPPAEKEVLAKTPLPKRAAAAGGGKVFKVVSWNITTLRSLIDKTPEKLTKLVAAEKPDLIICQETKLNESDEAGYEAKI
eukprot:CAMPEP_0114150746 /NCGR_PEP_ID=MMETSP0043_2-20121206/22884_1 /TAXON_ID=464988 /ORGANISM="Hemiselmis andersenii, Strain CCMP644" /LENGTH=184 /DNA_ID=CAMNT_0001245531 /DNA_START=123 /DNA_END=674 /DNA_ORIENTATION=-